jgi:hypothetical protein
LPSALGCGGFRLACVRETTLGLLDGFALLCGVLIPAEYFLVQLGHAFRGTGNA